MKGSVKVRLVLIIWVCLIVIWGLFKIMSPIPAIVCTILLICIRELAADTWLSDFPDTPSTAKFSLTYALGPTIKGWWNRLIELADEHLSD